MLNQNLDYFLAIVAAKNITKAADALYVSQPLLSRYLKNLEMEIGCSLFDRSKHPLKLTNAGERYLAYIYKLKSDEREFHNEIQEIVQAVRGTVKLGISAWRATYLIPEVLPAFLQQFPNIKVEILEGSQDDLAKLANEEAMDFCLMHTPNSYSNLNFDFIAREEIYLATHSNHPVLKHAQRVRSSPDGEFMAVDGSLLENLDYIMLNDNQNLKKYIYSYLNQHGILPNVIFRTSYIDTARALVEKGHGVTFVPGQGVGCGPKFHSLTYLSILGDPIQWDICFSWKTGTVLSPQSRLLMQYIKSAYERSLSP